VVSYADTGFLVSLYLSHENTSARARKVIRRAPLPVIVSPLTLLEVRNALNFSILRGEIDAAERDAVWAQVEKQMAEGFYQLAAVSQAEIYAKARDLSDRYTPTLSTRSLDLLHVATAVLVKARVFLTFDARQSKAAMAEGLEVRP